MLFSQDILRPVLVWGVTLAVVAVPALSLAAEGASVPDAASTPRHGNGALVICGGGDLPESIIDRFLELGGGKDARLVIIPTASRYADSADLEHSLENWREKELASLTVLHTRSRATADDPEFCKPLRDATAVWFIGGAQGNLVDAYLGTEAEKAIHAVRDRGGVIGGTSAGAAIMSPVMIRQGNRFPVVDRGFGFLPNTIVDQHFLKRNRQSRLLRVLEDHPHLVGVGIDEGTALVVEPHRVTVIGESQVLTYLCDESRTKATVTTLEPGGEIDLTALCEKARSRHNPAEPADSSAPVRTASEETSATSTR